MIEQITLEEVLELVKFEKIGGAWQVSDVLRLTGVFSIQRCFSNFFSN